MIESKTFKLLTSSREWGIIYLEDLTMADVKIEKAQIELADGRVINLNLYPDIAPLSVSNFIFLAKSGFYAGLCFHRVIPKFMVQGGGLSMKNGELVGKRANTIRGEFNDNGINNPLKHKAGVISMARTSAPNSASSQFFICVADTPFLDGKYAAFGECADKDSLKVAIELSKVKTHSVGGYDDVPCDDIIIKAVRIL